MAQMHRNVVPALPLLLVLALAAPAAAAVDQSKSFTAVPVDPAPGPSLDFSAAPWTTATQIGEFEVLSTRSAAVRFPTVAHVLVGKDALYVAIEATQSGVPITATQTTNSVGFGLDDFVGIGIDPTGNANAYYFETTPHAVRYQQSNE